MKIDPAKGLPSEQAIHCNLQSLARYAAISQVVMALIATAAMNFVARACDC